MASVVHVTPPSDGGLHGRGERVAVGIGRRDPQRDDPGAPDRGARGGERDARRAAAVELRDDAPVDDGLHARHARRRKHRGGDGVPIGGLAQHDRLRGGADVGEDRTAAVERPEAHPRVRRPGRRFASRERGDGEARDVVPAARRVMASAGEVAASAAAEAARGGAATPPAPGASAAAAAFGVNGLMSTGRGSNRDGFVVQPADSAVLLESSARYGHGRSPPLYTVLPSTISARSCAPTSSASQRRGEIQVPLSPEMVGRPGHALVRSRRSSPKQPARVGAEFVIGRKPRPPWTTWIADPPR